MHDYFRDQTRLIRIPEILGVRLDRDRPGIAGFAGESSHFRKYTTHLRHYCPQARTHRTLSTWG